MKVIYSLIYIILLRLIDIFLIYSIFAKENDSLILISSCVSKIIMDTQTLKIELFKISYERERSIFNQILIKF